MPGLFRREHDVARIGPTTPTRAGRLADASVDPTDERNTAASGRPSERRVPNKSLRSRVWISRATGSIRSKKTVLSPRGMTPNRQDRHWVVSPSDQRPRKPLAAATIQANGRSTSTSRPMAPRKSVGGTWQAASSCSLRRWNRGCMGGLLPYG
jgi:hypothetical protein